MSAVAIIPARGGSKRIPRKNIRDFCGKPMLGWPLETALGTGLFSKVIVSTDDDEVASIAGGLGAEISERPAELSGDHASFQGVMEYEARRLVGQDQPDHLCFILATAVFLTAEMLRDGAARMGTGQWDFAIHAAPFPSPVQRAFVLTKSGGTRMMHPENYYTRSQDLEPAFYDVGQCYWGRLECFLKAPGASFYGDRTVAIPVDRQSVVDIDTPEDWDLAETLHAFVRRPA